MRSTASFQFYGSLNDFLPQELREKKICYAFNGNPAIKDAIEAIGIPHPEVAGVLINKTPATLQTGLHQGDLVEIYPASSACLSEFQLIKLPRKPTFILDIHLGKLARYLRLAGFDTLYKNSFTDNEIADISALEKRVVLTRDKGLLKQKKVEIGYWLRSQNSLEQLKEVLNYFKINDQIKAFCRCMDCNGLVKKVDKRSIETRLLAKTKAYFQEFFQCQACGKIYWKGSHYDKMEALIKKLQGETN